MINAMENIQAGKGVGVLDNSVGIILNRVLGEALLRRWHL